MIDNLFSYFTPEVNSFISNMKTLFPLISIAALIWTKTSENAETDEAEAKRKAKRSKTIIIAVAVCGISLVAIPLIFGMFGG